MVYRVCFVVTNGLRRVKFLWITRRSSGLYFAFAAPGGMHHSYHKDGKSHWKLNDDVVQDLKNLPPLDSVKGAVQVTSGSFRLSDDALDGFQLPEFADEQVDELVYLDNRRSENISFDVWLVEPWQQAQVPLIRDWPAQLHITTHTVPWMAVVIYDLDARAGRAEQIVGPERG